MVSKQTLIPLEKIFEGHCRLAGWNIVRNAPNQRPTGSPAIRANFIKRRHADNEHACLPGLLAPDIQVKPQDVCTLKDISRSSIAQAFFYFLAIFAPLRCKESVSMQA